MRDIAVDLILGVGWVLALARLTRLVVKDRITEIFRETVFAKYGEESLLGYFLICPWCMSVWFGVFTAPYLIWITGISWWTYPIIVAAGSYVVGLSAENLEEEGDDIVIEEDDDLPDGGRHHA